MLRGRTRVDVASTFVQYPACASPSIGGTLPTEPAAMITFFAVRSCVVPSRVPARSGQTRGPAHDGRAGTLE